MSIKRFAKLAGAAVVGVVMMWGCGKNDNGGGGGGGDGVKGTMTDARDGKRYKTVKIGSQTWMAENLNYKTDSSWCYGDDNSNCVKYGRLYTWDAAIKACPAGWSLPTDAEWTVLVDFVGGEENAGTKLKSKTGWNNNGNGTDNHGFSALPGGVYWFGSFCCAGYGGLWWTATENDSSDAWHRDMFYKNEGVDQSWSGKDYWFSLRCLRDVR